jgi:histidine triad (HIT) family protein
VTPAYDPKNIFAKILRGEAPCVRLFEDDASLAFMDIMPRADGHALIIPKAPARNLLDIAPGALARMMPSVQRHLHFHILPRWTGVQLRPPGGPIASADQLEPAAAKIRAALG